MLKATTKSIASTQDMDYALSLVAKKFNLGDNYVMTEFKDGPNKCKVTLDNENYSVTVTVKNKMNVGFPALDPEEFEDEEVDTEE